MSFTSAKTSPTLRVSSRLSSGSASSWYPPVKGTPSEIIFLPTSKPTFKHTLPKVEDESHYAPAFDTLAEEIDEVRKAIAEAGDLQLRSKTSPAASPTVPDTGCSDAIVAQNRTSLFARKINGRMQRMLEQPLSKIGGDSTKFEDAVVALEGGLLEKARLLATDYRRGRIPDADLVPVGRASHLHLPSGLLLHAWQSREAARRFSHGWQLVWRALFEYAVRGIHAPLSVVQEVELRTISVTVPVPVRSDTEVLKVGKMDEEPTSLLGSMAQTLRIALQNAGIPKTKSLELTCGADGRFYLLDLPWTITESSLPRKLSSLRLGSGLAAHLNRRPATAAVQDAAVALMSGNPRIVRDSGELLRLNIITKALHNFGVRMSQLPAVLERITSLAQDTSQVKALCEAVRTEMLARVLKYMVRCDIGKRDLKADDPQAMPSVSSQRRLPLNLMDAGSSSPMSGSTTPLLDSTMASTVETSDPYAVQAANRVIRALFVKDAAFWEDHVAPAFKRKFKYEIFFAKDGVNRLALLKRFCSSTSVFYGAEEGRLTGFNTLYNSDVCGPLASQSWWGRILISPGNSPVSSAPTSPTSQPSVEPSVPTPLERWEDHGQQKENDYKAEPTPQRRNELHALAMRAAAASSIVRDSSGPAKLLEKHIDELELSEAANPYHVCALRMLLAEVYTTNTSTQRDRAHLFAEDLSSVAVTIDIPLSVRLTANAHAILQRLLASGDAEKVVLAAVDSFPAWTEIGNNEAFNTCIDAAALSIPDVRVKLLERSASSLSEESTRRRGVDIGLAALTRLNPTELSISIGAELVLGYTTAVTKAAIACYGLNTSSRVCQAILACCAVAIWPSSAEDDEAALSLQSSVRDVAKKLHAADSGKQRSTVLGQPANVALLARVAEWLANQSPTKRDTERIGKWIRELVEKISPRKRLMILIQSVGRAYLGKRQLSGTNSVVLPTESAKSRDSFDADAAASAGLLPPNAAIVSHREKPQAPGELATVGAPSDTEVHEEGARKPAVSPSPSPSPSSTPSCSREGLPTPKSPSLSSSQTNVDTAAAEELKMGESYDPDTAVGEVEPHSDNDSKAATQHRSNSVSPSPSPSPTPSCSREDLPTPKSPSLSSSQSHVDTAASTKTVPATEMEEEQPEAKNLVDQRRRSSALEMILESSPTRLSKLEKIASGEQLPEETDATKESQEVPASEDAASRRESKSSDTVTEGNSSASSTLRVPASDGSTDPAQGDLVSSTSSLGSFYKRGGLQRATEEKRMKELKELFELYDDSGDGRIDVTELPTLIRYLGYNPTEDEISSIMATYDSNCDGTLDFPEFVALIEAEKSSVKPMPTGDQVKEAFSLFSSPGDDGGQLDTGLLRTSLMNEGDPLSEEEAVALVSYVTSRRASTNNHVTSPLQFTPREMLPEHLVSPADKIGLNGPSDCSSSHTEHPAEAPIEIAPEPEPEEEEEEDSSNRRSKKKRMSKDGAWFVSSWRKTVNSIKAKHPSEGAFMANHPAPTKLEDSLEMSQSIIDGADKRLSSAKAKELEFVKRLRSNSNDSEEKKELKPVRPSPLQRQPLPPLGGAGSAKSVAAMGSLGRYVPLKTGTTIHLPGEKPRRTSGSTNSSHLTGSSSQVLPERPSMSDSSERLLHRSRSALDGKNSGENSRDASHLPPRSKTALEGPEEKARKGDRDRSKSSSNANRKSSPIIIRRRTSIGQGSVEERVARVMRRSSKQAPLTKDALQAKATSKHAANIGKTSKV